MGRVLCQSYHSLDGDSFRLCLDMWCVLPTRDDVADLEVPERIRGGSASLPLPQALSTSGHSPLHYFFQRADRRSRFVSVMRRLLARALKQKRGRTICRNRKRRTRLCAWEGERPYTGRGRIREWKKRASVNATGGLFSSGSSFSPRHDPPFATRATSFCIGSSITPFRLSIFDPLLPLAYRLGTVSEK